MFVCASDQLVLPLRRSVPVAHGSQSSSHYQLPTPGGAIQTAGNLPMNRTNLLLLHPQQVTSIKNEESRR